MRVLGIAALALLLVQPAIAAAPIRAKLATSSPTPVVDQPWRYMVTVRSAAGAPLAARVKLQILVGDTVVGCWKGGAMVQCFSQGAGDWIAFKGKRTGVLRFPAESVGAKLTFQATVKASGQVRRLRAALTVKAAPRIRSRGLRARQRSLKAGASRPLGLVPRLRAP
jgi:hypothetical protein